MSDTTTTVTVAELERRLNARQEADKEHRRQTLAMVTVIIGLATLLVSGGISWATANSQIGQKVDKIEQLKVDAGLNARVTVNTIRIDGVHEALAHIQASVDSVNVRLRQMACDRQSASCR